MLYLSRCISASPVIYFLCLVASQRMYPASPVTFRYFSTYSSIFNQCWSSQYLRSVSFSLQHALKQAKAPLQPLQPS